MTQYRAYIKYQDDQDINLVLGEGDEKRFAEAFHSDSIFSNKEGTVSFWTNKDDIKYMTISPVIEEELDEQPRISTDSEPLAKEDA